MEKQDFIAISSIKAQKYLKNSKKIDYMISLKQDRDKAMICANIEGLNDMKMQKDYENRFDKLEKIVLEGFSQIKSELNQIKLRLDKVESDIVFLKENVKNIWLKIEEIEANNKRIWLKIDDIETNTKHVWKNQNF